MTGPAVSRISDSFLVPIMPMNSTGMRYLPVLFTGLGVAVFRNREAQVAAEGGGVVFRADEAPVLQDRHDVLAEPLPLARVVDEEAEPGEATGVAPPADRVRDRLRRAGERGGTRGRDELHRLPEGVVVVRREPGDLLRSGAEAALGVDERLLRERGVQVVLPEVMPGERAAELGQRAVEVPVPGLQVKLDLAGLRVGVADVDRDGRHDDDLVRASALGGGASLEVAVERLRLRNRRREGEDALADRRAEIPALLGVAGLEDHRLALG